jgi:hypothetical protein
MIAFDLTRTTKTVETALSFHFSSSPSSVEHYFLNLLMMPDAVFSIEFLTFWILSIEPRFIVVWII